MSYASILYGTRPRDTTDLRIRVRHKLAILKDLGGRIKLAGSRRTIVKVRVQNAIHVLLIQSTVHG